MFHEALPIALSARPVRMGRSRRRSVRASTVVPTKAASIWLDPNYPLRIHLWEPERDQFTITLDHPRGSIPESRRFRGELRAAPSTSEPVFWGRLDAPGPGYRALRGSVSN